MKLNELIELCTNLQTRVLDIEKTKTTQANEIDSLKRRVKKLERRNKSRTHKLKRLYKVGLTTRVESSDNDESLGGEEVFVARQGKKVVEKVVDAAQGVDAAQLSNAKTTITTEIDEVTLAQALAKLKHTKAKAKWIVFMSQMNLQQQQQQQYLNQNHITMRAQKEQEANIAFIKEKDDIQAKVDVDYQLAERQQAEE
nr:hypothetical protein [Tanacetum cinerariifolium]